MKKSLEVQYCTGLLVSLGSQEKLHLLKNSNLTEREIKAITLRFMSGLTAKEVANSLNITEHSFQRYQKQIFEKLYLWLELTGQLKPLSSKIIDFLDKKK